MKKPVYLFTLLFISLITSSVQAAVSIYVKITDDSGTVITKGASGTVGDGQSGTIDLKDYIGVASVQYEQQQTLNIDSQGSGAGRLTFNPFVLTKTVDALSPRLMQYQASGTRLKKIEILFVKVTGVLSGRVYHKILLGNAFVKTFALSSTDDCGNGCPPVAESVSFEYGAMMVYTYTQTNPGNYIPDAVRYGWSRVKNAETDDVEKP